mmetsp:Transcript_2890/g.7536  ORF Transcript_2890/g.7536 Transcript_2890/m.7536 type:complete len:85 (-) Transcript_2890:1197-1451(-)
MNLERSRSLDPITSDTPAAHSEAHTQAMRHTCTPATPTLGHLPTLRAAAHTLRQLHTRCNYSEAAAHSEAATYPQSTCTPTAPT